MWGELYQRGYSSSHPHTCTVHSDTTQTHIQQSVSKSVSESVSKSVCYNLFSAAVFVVRGVLSLNICCHGLGFILGHPIITGS